MIQLAVIGCGAVVEELYLPALKEAQRRGYLRVAALVDTNAQRLQRLRRVFPKAMGCNDALEAYRSNSVDLTLIASPPAFHGEGARIALAHGSHVLCEKPLATSLEEAEWMAAQAQSRGRLLAVGFARRFFPNLTRARQLIKALALGEPLHFILREGKAYNWPAASDAPFHRESGGGVWLDIGAHTLDTLCWFFGEPVVRAFADDALTHGVEANCVAELEFPSASGTLHLSWEQRLASGLTVSGPKGALRVPPWELHQWEWRAPDGPWQSEFSDAEYPADVASPCAHYRHPEEFTTCIALQLLQVLRAILYSEPLPVSGQEALVSMRALQQCRAVAVPLEQEWLEETERAAFRQAHWRSACARESQRLAPVSEGDDVRRIRASKMAA